MMLLRSLALAALLSGPPVSNSDLDTARERYEQEDYSEAARILTESLQRDNSSAAAHELLASSMVKLENKDVAAHHMERAYELFLEEGEDKVARELKSRLYRTDPYASSRDKLFARITKRILDASAKLAKQGSTERALGLINGILPIARGKDLAAVEKLHSELAAAFEEVDLGAAGSEKDETGEWPLCERSSVRYELKCNLEPEVTELIGETMDSIFDYYVSLYFDGDDSEIKNQRATIRIYPSKEKMLENWQGSSQPEGWWSPGSREVVSFDTRERWGSLDSLLETLFHEASHQFMTFMSKGGRSPAWLNEGTSSFFEGAVAMADNRVLWPDAAIGRLRSLKFMLEAQADGKNPPRDVPTPRKVIEYMEPSSYPGSYYAFGWGYVFFLQQYEDPDTLEYVYRPLYAKYRDAVTTKQHDSMKLFEETFLGKASPRGHKKFADFEKDWIDWILNKVAPLHLSPPAERRELRLSYVNRYVDAADRAQGKKKAKVTESELLSRALGHLEYIRTQIDEEDAPDPELVLQQATILERLSFKESAAPLLELWLDLADAEGFEFEQELYDEVEQRLKKIDSKNHELRRLRSKITALVRNSKKLLAKYEKNKEPMPLRAYTFATRIASVFPTEPSLAADAARLKQAARDAGVLQGPIKSLLGNKQNWMDIYEGRAKPKEFSVSEESSTIWSLRPTGRINTTFELRGEYELRAVLTPRLKVQREKRATLYGLVVGGTVKGDWLLVNVTGNGTVRVSQLRYDGGGMTPGEKEEKPIVFSDPQAEDEDSEATEEEGSAEVSEDKGTKSEIAAGNGDKQQNSTWLPQADEPISLSVHVHDETTLTVVVNDSEPITFQVETRVPAKRFAGIFVNDGKVDVTEFVVEMFL